MRAPYLLVAATILFACDRPNEAQQVAPLVPPTPVVATAPVPPTPEPSEPAEPADVEVPDARDPCLVGTWRLPGESSLAFYRALLSEVPITLSSITGEASMTLAADGSATSRIERFVVAFQQSLLPNARPMDGTLTIDGSGGAKWRASGGRMAWLEPTFSVTGNGSVQIGGRRVNVPLDNLSESFRGTLDGYASYVCQPGRLAIRYQVAPEVTTVWVR